MHQDSDSDPEPDFPAFRCYFCHILLSSRRDCIQHERFCHRMNELYRDFDSDDSSDDFPDDPPAAAPQLWWCHFCDDDEAFSDEELRDHHEQLLHNLFIDDEVLSMLPLYDGKSVLELGAGIGRFTGELAQKAGQLVALDFVDSWIKENEDSNGHHKNVMFMCADVTSPELNISEESVDLIFTNWLLMYLSQEEVKYLAERMIRWLKVGGYIFFRQSCFHQSGDSKQKSNLGHYREPIFYFEVFNDCRIPDGSGNFFKFSLVSCKCLGTHVWYKRIQEQNCWLWKKVTSEDDRSNMNRMEGKAGQG